MTLVRPRRDGYAVVVRQIAVFLTLFRKAIAAAVAASLVLTAPGSAAAQMVGSQIAGSGRSSASMPQPVNLPDMSQGLPPGLNGAMFPGTSPSVGLTPVPQPHAVAVVAEVKSAVIAASRPTPRVPQEHSPGPRVSLEQMTRAGDVAVSPALGTEAAWATSAIAWDRATAPTGEASRGGEPVDVVETASSGDQGLSKGSVRGPPHFSGPPPSEGNGAGPGSPESPRRRVPTWLVAGLGVAAATIIGGFVFFPAAMAAGAQSLVVAALGQSLGAVLSQHGVVVAIFGVAAVPGYYVSNGLGFIFAFQQVDTVFKNRSANISFAKILTGIAASLLLALNWSFLRADFAAYQNLVGVLSFGLLIAQKLWYDRHPPAQGAPAPSRKSLVMKTGASVAVVGVLTYALGRLLMFVLPMLPMASLIVPFMVLAGVGFAFLMLPEYLKIEKEKSIGDASKGMAWSYFLAMASGAIWAVYQGAMVPVSAAATNLAAVLVFTGAATAASFAFFGWLVKREWKWMPQSLRIGPWTLSRQTVVSLAGLVALSIFMAAIFGLGYGSLTSVLSVPAEARNPFAAYLFYILENVLAAVVTFLTLRAFKKYGAAKP